MTQSLINTSFVRNHGVVGEYIRMINVPAKTEKLLKKYKDGLGHVFMITKNGFKQGSLRSLLNYLSKELKKESNF